MPPSKRRAERPAEQQPKKSRPATTTRASELRETAAEIIERTLSRRHDLTGSSAAEAERILALYTPVFRDLQDRVRAAESLEEIDELMGRSMRLAALLDQEMQGLQPRGKSSGSSRG